MYQCYSLLGCHHLRRQSSKFVRCVKCYVPYFQVKQGAENMIQSLTSGHSRDKKLLQEAQQMLADSRVKIEFLKLRILKIKQNKQLHQQQVTGVGDTSSNGDTQVKGEWVEHLHWTVRRLVW